MRGEYGGPFAEESAKILHDFETMVQLHLPYIRSENIVAIHPAGGVFSDFLSVLIHNMIGKPSVIYHMEGSCIV